MVRRIALPLFVALVLLGGPSGRGSAPAASACIQAPLIFQQAARQADFVVLADAVEVGGAANEQPPLPSPTPTNTFAPFVTSTPTSAGAVRPRGTRTPTPGRQSPTPTRTSYPTPTPYTMPDFTGFGATLSIVTVYAGDVTSPVVIDAASRAAIERVYRRREAQVYDGAECGSFPKQYELGARYLVLGRSGAGGPATEAAFKVTGDTVPLPANGLAMDAATYHRYLEMFGAVLDPDGQWAAVTESEIPLNALVRATLGVRGRLIGPPDTGSAGLAAGR